MSRFEDWLRSAGLDLEIHVFPAGVRTAEEAAASIGVEVGQIVKSLLFTVGGEPVVILMSGANRLDVGRLSALAGGPVEPASPARVREVTGYAIGGVPPFGHARPAPVLMDRDLTRHEVVWAAAGRPDAAFPIDPLRLETLSGAKVADLR